MALVDRDSEFGQRVLSKLQDEEIIWMTTVRSDGQPLAVPIWFLWDGDEELLMYSQPGKPKLHHIERNPRVGLHFNTDEYGNDVVRFESEARVDPDAPAAIDMPEMIEKYRAGITRIGTTPEGFSEAFSVPVRLRLTKLWGF